MLLPGYQAVCLCMPMSGSSAFQPVQLPPRLASQQQASMPPQRNAGTRYQNQRHPANRAAQVNKVGLWTQ